MGIITDMTDEFKRTLTATKGNAGEEDAEAPYEDMVRPGVIDCFYWMDKAAREAVCKVAPIVDPENDFGVLHAFEYDEHGRVYAEIAVRALNPNWNVKIPRNYAMVFSNVTNDAPCTVDHPGPRMLRYMPGFRELVRGTLAFGQGDDKTYMMNLTRS